MIRYVGLDVHKHFLEVCVIDGKGKVLSRSRVDCRRDVLVRFATQDLRKTDRVALEATTITWPVVDIVRPHVRQLVVGNPLKTKAIAEAKIKTDKFDAEVLAQLLRCEYLPDIWQPGPYRYARPELMAEKFAELRGKYLSVEERGHQPRLRASVGKGLGAVYLEAGLPPVLSPARLLPGERQMLEQQQLSGFVQELHRPTPTAARKGARKPH